MIDTTVAKIARAASLTMHEESELRALLRRSEQDAIQLSKLRRGNAYIDISFIHAAQAVFDRIPLEAVFFSRGLAKTVSNDTETDVDFNDTIGNSNAFRLGSDSTKIYIRPKNIAVIVGTMQWANNGTGRRAVHVNVYDANDVQLFGETLASVPPTGVNIDTIPYVGILNLNIASVSYLKITVVQTSGSDLDLNEIDTGIFLVK